VICCIVAAPIGWLVSRTDMPGAADHPRAGDGLVRDAAVSRRSRMGVAGGAEQRTVEPALSLPDRPESDSYLFNIYSLPGIIFVISCYTFPFVFVLVANALDNMPGELEDASRHSRRQGLDHGAARHDSAGAAGAGCRQPDRLPAGDDAVRIARDPGAAGRLPRHDHENLEPVPVPPKLELAAAARCRCCC